MRSLSIQRRWLAFGMSMVVFFAFGIAAARSAAAETARLYFKAPTSAIREGSEFSVSVFIDSKTPINAIDVQISFSPDEMTFIDSDASRSVVAFWQKGDVVLSNGHLHLVGGLLPAFAGTGGLVSTLRFKAIGSGSSALSFEKSSLVYLADGKGTRLVPTLEEAAISMHATIIPEEQPDETTAISPVSADATPPTLILREVMDSISGKNIIVYQAQDLDSGIRIVEMRIKKWGKWSGWQEISNPVVYPSGAESVEVRATNNSGGETVQSLSVPKVFSNVVAMLSFALLFLVFIVVYNIRRRLPKV